MVLVALRVYGLDFWIGLVRFAFRERFVRLFVIFPSLRNNTRKFEEMTPKKVLARVSKETKNSSSRDFNWPKVYDLVC